MENILVIDSSQTIATALKIKLERANFNVFVAHDIESVYYYIDEKFIDFFAVIMEVDIPGIKSKERFVEYIVSKRMATIILSAISDNKFIENMLKY